MVYYYLLSLLYYLLSKFLQRRTIMAQNSILLDKSLKFAARVVKLQRYLVKEKHEAIISKQINVVDLILSFL